MSGLTLSLIRPPFSESLERKLYDLHFSLRGPRPASGKVVIAAIDEKSLSALGRWPWPRGLFGKIFEKSVLQGAETVIPDIFFTEPSTGPEGSKNDQELAGILRRHPRILMGYYFLFSTDEVFESHLSQERLEENFRNVADSTLPPSFPLLGIRKGSGIQDTLSIFSHLPGGKRHGFFNSLTDPDGTVRSVPLLIAYRNRLFPSMALQIFSSDPNFSDYLEKLPLTEEGDFLVNYRGSLSSFPRISVSDLLEEKKPATLEGKIVLVGATAAGLEDNRPTPLDPTTPSVVLVANVVDNLIQGDFLIRDRRTEILSRLLLIVVSLLLGFSVTRLKVFPSLGVFLAVTLGEFLLLHFLFRECRWVFQNFYPLFAGFLTYSGTTLYRYLIEEREKRFISDTFQHYLSTDVIQELTEHPEKVRLGGERKELTVLFSDIRNFTSLVESTSPEVVGQFLNQYLTPVTDIIFFHKGLLDKYIGDAVMAVFGAPLPDAEHPLRACEAAIAMVRFVRATRKKWQRDFGIDTLKIGVGVNTGLMTVGNMGSAKRFDYTVIGDSVNLASRIEGLNKYYGTSLLVGESTYEKTRDQFLWRPLDRVRVKGKKEGVRIFELIVDPPAGFEEALAFFSSGLQYYEGGDFAGAIRSFEEFLQKFPQDGPASLLLGRCRQFEKSQPLDWEGTTTFLEK